MQEETHHPATHAEVRLTATTVQGRRHATAADQFGTTATTRDRALTVEQEEDTTEDSTVRLRTTMRPSAKDMLAAWFLSANSKQINHTKAPPGSPETQNMNEFVTFL